MTSTAEKKFVIPKQTKFDPNSHTAADRAMREQDRVLRWKKVHSLLRKHNKKARKEQDTVAKECAEVRAEKIFKKNKSEVMGLRFGVAMPPMTWNALVQSDRLIYGRSDLAEPDKEESTDLKATNQIVKDLEKAFPQYKVS